MKPERIHINIKLKNWAFETTDIGKDRLDSIVKNNKWLQPDNSHYLKPTIKQLSSFATRVHLPFGSFFLQTPPKKTDIRVAFRTKDNAPADVSLTLRDVIYEMQRKQGWFKEESGLANNKLSIIGKANGLGVNETLDLLREIIKLNHFKTARELYNDFRRQLSNMGILNMQKGNAGLGTNRPLKVSEVRAFVLLDDNAPLIFINQKDSYTARIFSIIHEFVHIFRGSDELLSGEDRDVDEERTINKVVSLFLMPDDEFKKQIHEIGLIRTAHFFNVSPKAASIRANEVGIHINFSEDENTSTRKHGGGNPYNNALSLNDNRYMNAIVSAQNSGNLQPTKAASLIGISYKMLSKTVDNFNEREALQ